jgi:hypothetical protein
MADLLLCQFIADKIAKAEGYGEKDATPTDARNPGDLMLGKRFDTTITHKGVVYTGTIGGITIFPKADRNTTIGDKEDGWASLWREVGDILDGKSIFYHSAMTIQQIADIWTRTDPDAWAKNVADGLSVSLDTKLSAVQIETA